MFRLPRVGCVAKPDMYVGKAEQNRGLEFYFDRITPTGLKRADFHLKRDSQGKIDAVGTMIMNTFAGNDYRLDFHYRVSTSPDEPMAAVVADDKATKVYGNGFPGMFSRERSREKTLTPDEKAVAEANVSAVLSSPQFVREFKRNVREGRLIRNDFGEGTLYILYELSGGALGSAIRKLRARYPTREEILRTPTDPLVLGEPRPTAGVIDYGDYPHDSRFGRWVTRFIGSRGSR